MMKIATVLAALFVAAISQAADREPIDDVTYFSCNGAHGTYNEHPFDCTRFIQCHNGRAADQPCASCQGTGRYCPEGYLVFDINIRPGPTCNWPDETYCHSRNDSTTTVRPSTTTERPSTTTVRPSTTTERPSTTTETASTTTVRPPTTTVRPPTTTDEGTTTTDERTTTTVRPSTTTVRPPTTTEGRPTTTAQPGDECDPKDCFVRGDCRSYQFCQRIPDDNKSPDEEVGKLVEAECDEGLWFNPAANNSSVHGGTCDTWVNLSEETRIQYDIECVCNFFPVGPCSPQYIYQDAEPRGSDNWVNQTLTCPSGLNWNQQKRVCSSQC